MSILNSLLEFYNMIPRLKITDVIDIVVVAYLIYKVLAMVRKTSTSRIAKSVLMIVLISWLTGLLQMHALNYVLSFVLELGAFALIIIFQPELRRMLERFGGKSIREWFVVSARETKSNEVIAQTVLACEKMAQKRIGALIVFERNTSLESYLGTGTIIDARLSEQLLSNLFFPKAALHDGALIVRGDRAVAAGCVLPLTENTRLSADLGTRHRAGIGLSELSDAVIVIVSEETGVISAAVGGMLKRHLAPQTLQKLLEQELLPDADDRKSGLLARIRSHLAAGGEKHDQE